MKIIFIHSPPSWSWWRLLWKTNLITWYTCLNWAGTQSWLQHTKPSATPSRHRWPDCWNGNSPLSLCSVIILPRGLLYMSAQISLSVTSVNNGNKERTCRCWCVPPRQSTCHQEASPPPRHPPSHLILLLAICRSTDQTARSHESARWSWWRSGLDPFNTASTSNNSRLWQLCIIHLVESLSLSSLTLPSPSPFPSPSPLSVSLQFFFFFFLPVPPGAWRRGEGEAGQCSIRCCLFPPDTSDFGDTEVFVCSTLPRPCEFWMPSEPDCVRSLWRLNA